MGKIHYVIQHFHLTDESKYLLHLFGWFAAGKTASLVKESTECVHDGSVQKQARLQDHSSTPQGEGAYMQIQRRLEFILQLW